MYPTIFAMGLKDVGDRKEIAGSLLVVTFLGGALLPLVMGYLSDFTSIATAFIVPMICCMVIGLFGLFQKDIK